jgi:outer membrane protein TolC
MQKDKKLPGRMPGAKVTRSRLKAGKTIIFLLLSTPLCALQLHDAHDTALSQRPLLKAHEQTITANKAAESAAFAGYLPQLSATNTSLFEAEKGVDTTVHTIKLTGSQLIFDLAGPLAQSAIAKQATKQAQHTYRAATHATQEAVTHAFLDAWLIQEKQSYIETLSRVAQRSIATANHAHSLQATSTHTHAKALSLDAKQQAAVNAYDHELTRTRQQLYSLLDKTDDNAILQYSPLTPGALQNEDHYQELARAHRPELQANKAQQAQHDLQRRASTAQYLPKVSLTGSVSKAYSGNTSLRGTDSLVGLHATWSFFDGGTNYHRAREAEARRLRTQFELHELHNRIAREVSTAYHQLQEQLHTLNAATAAFDEHAGTWRRAQQQHRLQAISDTALLKEWLAYETAAHELRISQTAVRKLEETLAYRCGYPGTWPATTLTTRES